LLFQRQIAPHARFGLVVLFPALLAGGVAFPVIAVPAATVEAWDSPSVSPAVVPQTFPPTGVQEVIVVLLPAPVPTPVMPLPSKVSPILKTCKKPLRRKHFLW
jgi:hypothetical protein